MVLTWLTKQDTEPDRACEAPPIPSVKPESHILHVWLSTLKLWGVLKWQPGPSSGCLDLHLMSGQGKQTYGFTAQVVTQSFSCSFKIFLILSSQFPWHCYFRFLLVYHQGHRLALTFSKFSTIAAPHWPFSDACTATTATSCLLCSLPTHTALAEGSWHSTSLAFQPDSYQVHSQFSCSNLNFQACVLCLALMPYYAHSHVHVDFPFLQILWSFPTQPHAFHMMPHQTEQAPSSMVSNNLKLSNPSQKKPYLPRFPAFPNKLSFSPSLKAFKNTEEGSFYTVKTPLVAVRFMPNCHWPTFLWCTDLPLFV